VSQYTYMLADLGVAKQLLGVGGACTYAGTEGVYMAPEVRGFKPAVAAGAAARAGAVAAAAAGETSTSQGSIECKPYGVEVDIWSLGIMFLEIRWGWRHVTVDRRRNVLA
jgi:serine/threonine protein kinase